MYLSYTFIAIIITANSFSQSLNQNNIWLKAIAIDKENTLSYTNKLALLYKLKVSADNAKLRDTAYAFLLVKIGKYEFLANKNYRQSLQFTEDALTLNKSLQKENSKFLSIYCYHNLASYYQTLNVTQKAFAYYDTTISLCKDFLDIYKFQLDCRYQKADLYFSEGDYQKSLEESIEGINRSILEKDTSYYIYFLNRKAQSLCFENNLEMAIKTAQKAVPVAQSYNDQFELATAYKNLGFIYEKSGVYKLADYFFKQSALVRSHTQYYDQVANDYIDWGNFYLNSLHNYTKAQNCYYKTLAYAAKVEDPSKRSIETALANVNLGENCFYQKKYKEAGLFYLQSFNSLKLNLHNEIQLNPTASELNLIPFKELAIVLMTDKTQLLLQLFKNTHQMNFLNACVQTAIITDSILTQIRNKQIGEQSKLYWRMRTRNFYEDALNACYLNNNAQLAFYFMEKSRAVLLNDKLNELGAGIHLPPAEAAKEEGYQVNITQLQLQLSNFDEASKEYTIQQNKLLLAKEDYEHYIKSLEQKYPAYYQYKYADSVPSLKTLQQFLAGNNQSFIHYFLNDSVLYVLAITPSNTTYIKLTDNRILNKLSSFLQMVSDKDALNNHYNNFSKLANDIDTVLFKPLQLPKGKIIICTDNFLIPFEALCSDAQGKHFLINDYTFSYAYSARYVLNKFIDNKASGNFLGIAPVTFSSYLHAAPLTQSANAIGDIAKYYSYTQLLENNNAIKNNFIKQMPLYTIVNIFSHASADTSQKEPLLFMADSAVRLSELQLINNPATKLVILSACETNVGKNETGEGIYSLARGFATTGIPSVAATLWKADEQAIYSITKNFNRYISQGIDKDDALQKAKLDFIKTSREDKLLPYYWANIILIGNTAPIRLSQDHHIWLWLIAATVILLSLAVIILKKKKKFM